MNDGNRDSNEQYQRVRSDFDALATEDKVVFLVEATASTVVRSVQHFGQVLSEQVEDMFRGRSGRGEARRNEGAPKANEEQASRDNADSNESSP